MREVAFYLRKDCNEMICGGISFAVGAIMTRDPRGKPQHVRFFFIFEPNFLEILRLLTNQMCPVADPVGEKEYHTHPLQKIC